jgi:hypothetical protein
MFLDLKILNYCDNDFIYGLKHKLDNNPYFIYNRSKYLILNSAYYNATLDFNPLDFSKFFNYYIFDNFSDDYVDNKFLNNFKVFINNILITNIKNKYEFNYDTAQAVDPNYSLYLKIILNDDLTKFDIETYIKYLYLYFKPRESESSDNFIINSLSNLFIEIFNSKRGFYDFMYDYQSRNYIIEKDKFNFFRNYKSNLTFLYSKNERNLDTHLYDGFKKTNIHYEKVSNPKGFARNTLLNYEDVRSIYSRYINFNKYAEIFINSYLWLSLEDSNIKLEKFEYLLFLNKYLNQYKNNLDNYFNNYKDKLEYNNDLESNFSNLNLYTDKMKNHLNEVLKFKQEEQKEEKANVFIVNQVLKFDYFIKSILFDEKALFNEFSLNKNKNPYSMLPANADYIFFKNYCTLYNIEYNIYDNIKINVYNCNKVLNKLEYEMPLSYRAFLALNCFFDFVKKNN